MDLRRHTINSNDKCKACQLRYLCGGTYRAWNWKAELLAGHDARQENCKALKERAETILYAAGNI